MPSILLKYGLAAAKTHRWQRICLPSHHNVKSTNSSFSRRKRNHSSIRCNRFLNVNTFDAMTGGFDSTGKIGLKTQYNIKQNTQNWNENYTYDLASGHLPRKFLTDYTNTQLCVSQRAKHTVSVCQTADWEWLIVCCVIFLSTPFYILNVCEWAGANQGAVSILCVAGICQILAVRMLPEKNAVKFILTRFMVFVGNYLMVCVSNSA